MIPALAVLLLFLLRRVPPIERLQEHHEAAGIAALRPYARPLSLLYAIVVKLDGVESSLRQALQLSEDQIARVRTVAEPEKLIGMVGDLFRTLGVQPPPPRVEGGS